MPDYSPHQKRIIRNYYDNRKDLMLQKLGELVSELANSTGKRHHIVAGQGNKGAGHVDEDDAITIALFEIFRRKRQAPDRAGQQENCRQGRQPGQPQAANAVKPARRTQLVEKLWPLHCQK